MSFIKHHLSHTYIIVKVLIFALCSFVFTASLQAEQVLPKNDTSLLDQTLLAKSTFEVVDRSEDRAAFLRAERTLWQMDYQELAKTIDSLNQYPLIPYLLEKKLNDNIRLSDKPMIEAFLTQYEGTPLERSLRRNWLKYLSRRDRAADFIRFYKPTSDAKLACTFIQYQIRQGVEPEKLFPKIAELWTVGKSQPKACDSIFKVWMDAGNLTDDVILARIQKAADGGKHTLIPYLTTLLSEDKKYLAELWHRTRRDPSFVRNTKRFINRYPEVESEIMAYGLSRLIWRDQNLALKVVKSAEKTMSFSDEQKAKIYGRFGIKLAIDNHKEAQTYLLKADEVGSDSEVTRWHLAHLLRQQDWSSIILLVENLNPQSVSSNAYQYWLARAYEQLDRKDEAKVLYEQLSSQRHYYGFLASAQLGQPYHLEHQPVKVDADMVKNIIAMDSSQRAYELKQLGRYHEARLEWRHTQRQLDDEAKLATSVIASAWDWHDQAIFTFSREGYLNDVKRRFPTAHEDIITREAQRNKIEPEWAFAIARRESSFMSDAVSSANARGLMQILPSTAKYLEKKRVTSSQLLDVETNAKIGNKYLRYLMNKLDNNTILATASYNAGWRRVKQWLPEEEALEADIWVELIPFKETRNYVKAVMAYKQIYHAQLVDKIDLDSQLIASPSKVFTEFIETDIPVSL